MKTKEFKKWLEGGRNPAFAIDDNPEIIQGIESLRVQANELGKMVCPRSTFSVEVVDNNCTVCYELDGKKYEYGETYNPIFMSVKDFKNALRSAAFLAMRMMALENNWEDGIYNLFQRHKKLDGLMLEIVIQEEHSREYQLNTVENWMWCWVHHDASLPQSDAQVISLGMYYQGAGEKAIPLVETKGMRFLNLMERVWSTYRFQYNDKKEETT